MDDVIHEQGHNVPVYANMSIKCGWIFLIKDKEVINNGKSSKIIGFYAAQNWKKNPPMVPLWIIFKGKIKIAHLLPEWSALQDDHFLQSWPLLSGVLD